MKTKSDIIIKVLSLGVGLAVGIVLIAKVCFELSYDSFYKDIDRVYRIQSSYTMNGTPAEYGQVSGGVSTGFMYEIPGVEAATRTTFSFNNQVYLDEAGNKLDGYLAVADTCFFKVFDRKILAGDPVKALGKRFTVVVSERFAKKLGGVRECIGQQIANIDNPDFKMTVEGVFEDFPENGILNYDILLAMEGFIPKWSQENWMGNDRYRGYVKLLPGVDPHGLKDAIRKMQETHQSLEEYEKKGISLVYWLKPFNTIHTSDPAVRSQVVLLSIVAFLLILISLLNYILMVISSLVKRSKEVGVRKCYGAESRHIYGLLSREAFLHLTLSLLLASAIIFAGRSIIENLLGVPFMTLLIPESILAIAALLALVLVVSVVVPAELYQRIPIYAALRNYTERSRKWKLGLLGSQVLINVFLMVMLLVIGRQYHTVLNSDLGYDYKNLYFIGLYDVAASMRPRVVESLRGIPEVKGVAAAYNIPLYGSSGEMVRLPGDDRELFNFADQFECTPDFFGLMGIPFIEGRAPMDDSEVAVDEAFAEKMGEFTDWSDGAVGKQLLISGHGKRGIEDGTLYTVSGVYRRFMIRDVEDPDDRPGALFYGEISDPRSTLHHIYFKVDPESLEKVQAVLADALEGQEVEIISYEEQVRAVYAGSRKMRNTVAVGAVFSLLIALLGLIGFIRDESLRRSKEMAIRKINGASTGDIIGSFAKAILYLSLVMGAAGCVLAYIVADKWLQQFAEKVPLHPLYFIGGAAFVLLLVLVVLVLNCLRIARSNPVDSLKNE